MIDAKQFEGMRADFAEDAKKFFRRDFVGCRGSWVSIARGECRGDRAVTSREEAADFARGIAARFGEN